MHEHLQEDLEIEPVVAGHFDSECRRGTIALRADLDSSATLLPGTAAPHAQRHSSSHRDTTLVIDRHFPDQLRCAGVAGANAGLVWQGLMPGLRVRHCLQLASTSFADGRMCLPHSAHSFFTAATSEPAAPRELMRAVRSPSHTIAQCTQWASAAQRVIQRWWCLRVEYAVPYRSVRWLRMLPTGSDLAAFALPARQLMSDAVFLTRPRTDPSLPADHRAAGTALHCARTSAHFHTHSALGDGLERTICSATPLARGRAGGAWRTLLRAVRGTTDSLKLSLRRCFLLRRCG